MPLISFPKIDGGRVREILRTSMEALALLLQQEAKTSCGIRAKKKRINRKVIKAIWKEY